MDDPATVHDLNVLTVVAAEAYKEFVAGLQREIAKAISARPRRANADYFTGKILQTDAGDVQVTPAMAKAITRHLIKNDYTDDDDNWLPRRQGGRNYRFLSAGVGRLFGGDLAAD